jgi:predicted GTPase
MSKELEYNPIYDSIVQQIKQIDRDDLSDDVDQGPLSSEVEKQKVYTWIRLYIKEEMINLKEGDNFKIKYLSSGEELITKFICFGKKNSFKDSDDYEQIQITAEDDSKCLCLMVDEQEIQTSEDIPFIRSLFRISKHFQYQVYKREELVFTNIRTGQSVEYIDCDF